MRPSDRDIRIVAALIVVAGLAACGVAIFSEALGLGGEQARGMFGWKRASLLVFGVAALAVGAALIARPRIVPRPLTPETIRARIGGLSDREARIAGSVALIAGIALCASALFASRLDIGPLITTGALGWRQIALLLVGGLIVVLGALLLTRPLGGARWRIDAFGLLYALGVYAVVQFVLLKPPELSDQLNYLATADELPDVEASHRNVRIGLLFPVRGAIELFSYSEAAYYAVPFLSGLALAGFTYVLARMLFGSAVAIAAALLVTLNAYVLWDSSHLLPDVPAAAALVGAIAAFVGAGILQLRPRVDWRSTALLVAGGFLLGWAYLTREYLLVMLPIVLVVFFAYRIPWRRLGWVASGLVPPLILEAAWGIVNYGDPLIRLSTSASPRPAPTFLQPSAVPEWQGGGFITMDALEVIWQLPSHFLERSGGWLFVLLFFGVLLYGSFAAIRGDRRFLPLVAWVGGLWLFLTMVGLVPIVLTDGEALLRLQVFRYWLPIMPGLVVGGLAVVAEVIRIVARRQSLARPLSVASVGAITLVALAAGTASISGSPSFVRNGADQYLELRDFLRDEGAAFRSFYTDHGSYQSLALAAPIYIRGPFGSRIWEGEIRALSSGTNFLSADEIGDGLVVVRPRSIRWLVDRSSEFSPPRYLLDPPSEWQPVMISGNGEIAVYAITPGRRPTALHTVTAADWRIAEGGRGTADATVENGHAVIEVPTEDSVFVLDGRGSQAGAPAALDEGSLASSETVWGRVEMATEGSGSASIRCYFYGQQGRILTPVGARAPYIEGLEAIDYRCRAPKNGGPFSVRVAIEVRGPLKLTLGENAVYVAPEEVLAG